MCNQNTLKKALSEGNVAVVHLGNYPNTPTHYVSILDINEKQTKIYISDPWGGTSYNGWHDISMIYDLGANNNSIDSGNDICFVSSDGKVVNYSDDGTSSESSGTTDNSVDMSKNIVENGHDGYKINIKLDKEIDDMLAKLKMTGFKMEKYLSSKKQKEYLKNMIKAAIVTQYPDLRSAKEIAEDADIRNGEIQGCIKIKRYADGETKVFGGGSLNNPVDNKDDGMYLAYKPYDEFSKMISDGDRNALKYFSMDSSNNIVVAGWETMNVNIDGPTQTNIDEVGRAPDSYKEEYKPISEPYQKLIENKINYLDQVSNYAMPFSLMWSLLIYGHDEDFVNDLANLVIDTEIVIGCYDATNIRVTTHEFTYSKIGEAKIEAYLTNPKGNEPGATESKQYTTVQVEYKFKVTETDTLKTDTPSLKVKYANTWTAIYDSNYKVKTKNSKKDEQTTKHPDEITDNQIYQIKGEKYTGDRKPDDASLVDKINKVVEEESEEILNKYIEELNEEVETQNKKIQYKYKALQEAIDKNYSKQANGSFYDFINIKDVQSNIINMIIEKNTKEGIQSVFNEENALMLKYAKSADKQNYKKILDNAVSCVLFLQEDEELYNKITKNGKDFTKAKVFNSNISSIQISETKKKTNFKETVNQSETTATVEDVTKSGGNIKLKTDKNGTENSFVKLLHNSKNAKGNLKIIDSWFFDSVEDTAAIADLEDLLKYLFQCAYNKDYGIKKEDIEKLKDFFNPEKNMTKVSTSRTKLKGGSLQVQVWNYFVDLGFSDEATAGIMGNFQQESSFDPTCETSAAGGICQFEKGTGEFANMEKYAKSKGKPWTDLQCQLEYLMKLLPGAFTTYTGLSPHYYDTGEWCWWPEKMTLNDFKKLNDPEKAAEIFCRVYERASLPMIQNRKDYARDYYKKYHK